MSGKIELYQTGRKWNATDGNETETGNSPKAVIAALFAKKPELAGSEIVYNLVKSNDVIQDASVCPTCGKNVVYVKGRKSNGRVGVMVIHDDEEKPVDAQVVTEGNITREYMLWLLERAHDPVAVAKVKEPKESKEPKSETAMMPLVTIGSSLERDDFKKVIKEKVVLARRSTTIPIVDITCSKRNRFIIIGGVIKAMRDSGRQEEELNAARTEMSHSGMNFVEFVDIVSKYAQLYDTM